MRRSSLLVAALLLSWLGGCGVRFDVDYAIPEQTVPGSPLGGLLPSFVPSPIPLNVDLKSETDAMNTGPATHVYLKSLALTITPHDKPSGNFDFLSSVQILVGPRDSSSTLPQKEVAHIDSVPKGATEIDLQIIDGVDLLPYLNAGASLTGTASGNAPAMDVTYDGLAVFTLVI